MRVPNDPTMLDSPRKEQVRRLAREWFEESGEVILWTDTSVCPQASTVAVAQAWPAKTLVCRESPVRRAAVGEREALQEGVKEAVRLLSMGVPAVTIQYDNPQAKKYLQIPERYADRIRLVHSIGSENLAHGPAGMYRRQILREKKS